MTPPQCQRVRLTHTAEASFSAGLCFVRDISFWLESLMESAVS